MAKSVSNAERFLGPEAARGGPFALLGVSPDEPGHAVVVAALEGRLSQVNAHPHSETPQADEVRLALHAAAAQLLDPVVRRHMVERWGGGEVAIPKQAPIASSEVIALESDAILTLGMYGGWNRASLRRIAMLAHARGVPSHRVADAIRAIAHRRTPASIAPAAPTRTVAAPAARESTRTNGQSAAPRAAAPKSGRKPPEIEPMVEPEESSGGNIRLVLGVTLGVLIAAVSLLGVLSILWQQDPGEPAPGRDTLARGPVEPPDPTPAQPEPEAPAEPEPESAPQLTIRQSLDRAREALAIDPDTGVEEIVSIIGRIETGWVSMAADERKRIHADLVDLLYRASADAQHVAAITGRIAEGARSFAADGPPTESELQRAAWSSGMLVRLSRESNLPVSAAGVVDSALAASYAGSRPPQDATFERGAVDFLARAPGAMLEYPSDDDARPAAVWEAWVMAALAATPAEGSANEILLSALDQLLRDGPEVTRRAWALGASERIVGELAWDAASPARQWLVSAFNAPALTSADLFAVTSSLSKQRGIDGVDPTMTLDAQASERARAELRNQYAAAWGMLDATQGDDVLSDLRSAIADAARAADRALTSEEHLAATARLALLNEAASWIWKGELDRAADTLSRIEETVEGAMRSPRPAGDGLSERDSSEWAVRYLGVRRNQQARIELLDALSQRSSTSTLDPMDAEVLVREAIRGDRSAVRRRAHEVVRQFLSQAPVVNALLEELPDAPETRSNARLISDAAGIRTLDPTETNWRIEARRGLVERLLELVAGESPEASIDRLSRVIGAAYAARASQTLDEAAPGVSAEIASMELRRRWRRRAANVLSTAALSLDRIERERVGRASGSRGPVQVFAAEQLATCELMAYVVIGEQAGVNEEVLSVLREMEGRRQGARHIFEQLGAVENAMAELWLMRLRE